MAISASLNTSHSDARMNACSAFESEPVGRDYEDELMITIGTNRSSTRNKATMSNLAAPVSLKHLLQTAGVLSTVLLMWCAGVHAVSANERAEIDKLMSTLYERGQFNGAILVAMHGNTIYREAFGKANFQTGADFTPETPSNIGSVTKQFTAMSIMTLAEREKLSYDDPVSKYIQEFSRSAHLSQITLRQLLNHTSGIPDYGDLGIDDAGLDQKGLIAALLKKEDALAKPGLKYRYSNPGYALLAVVIERVSGERFGEFLEQEMFEPVGMSNTFVYDGPGKKTARTAVGYGQFGQVDDGGPTAIPGDGGIYSTIDDLFKWDQALYTDRLVHQSTLAEAFAQGKVQEGISTYGFGWNIEEEGGSKYLWHTGSQAGFRAFIGRRLAERVTVIMLTNKGNSKRQDINVAIQNILADKPYVPPKQSGAEKLYKTIHGSGIQVALQMFDALKNSKRGDYDLGESELNTLGYQLLYGDRRASEAIAIFKLNTMEHPASSNAFDSLGEAYGANGEKDLAISSYKMAVKLDPTNGHAAGELKELKLGRVLWLALPTISAIGVLLVAAILVKRRRARPRVGQLPEK
jgi:CubicO group peptidase (beta-lactamase class C family)